MKTSNIKEALMQGQDLEQWHKNKLRSVYRFWFLMFCFFTIIFGGHVWLSSKRYNEAIANNYEKDSTITYQRTVIGIQKLALDSAVYFSDILKRGGK